MIGGLALAELEKLETEPAQSGANRPTALKLLLIWSVIGAQSFGGGPATLQMIQREMVTRRNWLSEAEYWRFWTFCPLVPGINLIAFAILIGQRLAGWRGILATLAGMLVPSTVITIGLTAGFTSIQNWPPLQAMLKGIIPATAGLLLGIGVQMSRPIYKELRKEGWQRLSRALLVITGAVVLLGGLGWPVVAVLLAGISAGAFLLAPPTPARERQAELLEGQEPRP